MRVPFRDARGRIRPAEAGEVYCHTPRPKVRRLGERFDEAAAPLAPSLGFGSNHALGQHLQHDIRYLAGAEVAPCPPFDKVASLNRMSLAPRTHGPVNAACRHV